MASHSRFLLMGVVLGVCGTAACGTSPFSPAEARTLASAWNQWESVGPLHYTLEMRRGCFCPPEVAEWATVEVDHDTLVAVTFLTGDTVPHAAWYARPPVPGLFNEIRSFRPDWLADIRASYDAATGYPTRVTFDSDNSVTDAGMVLEARNLITLPWVEGTRPPPDR